jgi:NAD(P)-dependent dehydrogenase (short-subunit alcohol dehydrogenase family)
MGDLRRQGSRRVSGRLAGKVALVTGAAGGIGAAIARRFADEGATTVVADLRRPDVSLGIGDLTYLSVDILDPGAVGSLFASIGSSHRRLDVLVHCAAKLGGSGPFLDVPLDDWRSYIDVNLTGTFLICQHAAKAMVACGVPGRIITTGSINSFAAEPAAAPYASSKGGVRLLTKAMAVDLAPYGITVNMLAPGAITVPRNAGLFAEPALVRQFNRQVPLGAPGLPADVAHAALFLAEDGARYVTGAEILVDGGLIAQILPAEQI